MRRPANWFEWCGEFVGAACIVALPLIVLFIGAAFGLK